MYLFSPPPNSLPSRLAHNIEQSSMCYTIGFCWLSILNLPLSDLNFGKKIVRWSPKGIQTTTKWEGCQRGSQCWMKGAREQCWFLGPSTELVRVRAGTHTDTHTHTLLTIAVFSLNMLPPSGSYMCLLPDFQLCSQFSWKVCVQEPHKFKPSCSTPY